MSVVEIIRQKGGRLTEQDRERIKEDLVESNYTTKQLCLRHGISVRTLYRVKNEMKNENEKVEIQKVENLVSNEKQFETAGLDEILNIESALTSDSENQESSDVQEECEIIFELDDEGIISSENEEMDDTEPEIDEPVEEKALKNYSELDDEDKKEFVDTAFDGITAGSIILENFVNSTSIYKRRGIRVDGLETRVLKKESRYKNLLRKSLEKNSILSKLANVYFKDPIRNLLVMYIIDTGKSINLNDRKIYKEIQGKYGGNTFEKYHKEDEQDVHLRDFGHERQWENDDEPSSDSNY